MSTAAAQQLPRPDIRDFMATAVAGSIFGSPHLSGTVHICSIYPRELRDQRPHMSVHPNPQYDERAPKGHADSIPFVWANQTTYVLPAAPDIDHPSILPIYDTGQMTMSIPDPDAGVQRIPGPISARIAAEALVHKWTNYTVGAEAGRKIGVGIIAGPEPTTEEIAQLNSLQQNLFRFLVREADQFDHERKRNLITDLHIDALKGIGQKRDWMKALHHEAMKECIACGSPIQYEAERCSNCSTNLVEYLAGAPWHSDEVKEARDPHCFALAKKLRKFNEQQASVRNPDTQSAAEQPNEINKLPENTGIKSATSEDEKLPV